MHAVAYVQHSCYIAFSFFTYCCTVGEGPAGASAPAGKSRDKDAATPVRENLADIAEGTASPTDSAAKTEPKQPPAPAAKLPEPQKVQTEARTKAPEEQKSASAAPTTSTAKDPAAGKESAATKPVSRVYIWETG